MPQLLRKLRLLTRYTYSGTALVEAEKPKAATSVEPCTVGFEVQVPKDASGTVRVPVYALYHLCDDAGGQCRFVRLDAVVELRVRADR